MITKRFCFCQGTTSPGPCSLAGVLVLRFTFAPLFQALPASRHDWSESFPLIPRDIHADQSSQRRDHDSAAESSCYAPRRAAGCWIRDGHKGQVRRRRRRKEEEEEEREEEEASTRFDGIRHLMGEGSLSLLSWSWSWSWSWSRPRPGQPGRFYAYAFEQRKGRSGGPVMRVFWTAAAARCSWERTNGYRGCCRHLTWSAAGWQATIKKQ